MMLHDKEEYFALKNFEGPLDFLLHLIQKDEIDIYDVPIHELTHQFIQKLTEQAEKNRSLELSSEWIGMISSLVLLKSRTMLPSIEQQIDGVELVEDPHFEIIHHLLDYCRFKQAAKELQCRREQQEFHFFRGITFKEASKKSLGIDHISLEDLNALFVVMMKKVELTHTPIYEEHWKVSDKIEFIKDTLKLIHPLPLYEVFKVAQSRIELIVSFLALLELMKMGTIIIGRQKEASVILIFIKEEGVSECHSN